jgi:Uma2 family endonuclease
MSVINAPLPAEQIAGRVTLERVPWNDYESLLALVGDRALRLTYDRGRLEIEMPSVEHERLKSFVGRLIETYALEAGIDVFAAGSATWRRQPAQGGLEADECYYVHHYSAVVDKKQIDLANDPPPDLAIEIDLSTSSIDKASVYARIGIPELWRLHDDELECLQLSQAGTYEPARASSALPKLNLNLVADALRARAAVGEAAAVRQFVASLRRN